MVSWIYEYKSFNNINSVTSLVCGCPLLQTSNFTPRIDFIVSVADKWVQTESDRAQEDMVRELQHLQSQLLLKKEDSLKVCAVTR